jgi:adenosylcobinamide-phosphate synthase
MMEIHPAYTLLGAFILDLILGDPRWLFHPVRWMGMAISHMEPIFRRQQLSLVISGAMVASLLILGTWGGVSVLVYSADSVHPVCRQILETLLIYYCISPSSLRKEALAVHDALYSGGLAQARKKVSFIVGRDTEHLSEQGVIRAAVETVAENLVDGVISPLFYAAIGGAPLAMAYRMVNTLDSMVGYRNEKYLKFGKASARIDDIANYIPARISVPIIAFAAQILSGSGKRAFLTAVREGSDHASPNSGYSEAAFAGALSVKLNGPSIYHGRVVNKPFIGKAFGDVTRNDIRKACDLMFFSSFLWAFLLAVFFAWK